MHLEERIKKLTGSSTCVTLYDGSPSYMLMRQDGTLVLAGTETGVKNGITRFLKGGLLAEFRFVRSLYRNDTIKDMVLGSLVSTREKIAALLEEHYGPATYSKHESAFDEYLESMRERYGFTITDEQVTEHAGIATVDNLKKIGFDSPKRYLISKTTYEERERMLIEIGGFSYKEWMEKEIDRFLAEPSLLITEYDCIFENIFPETVQVDAEKFCGRVTEPGLPVLAKLIFGRSAAVEPDDGGRSLSITGIPAGYHEYFIAAGPAKES